MFVDLLSDGAAQTATGYAVPRDVLDRALALVREALTDAPPLPTAVTRDLLRRAFSPAPPGGITLTSREHDVLRGLARGATQKEIAATLFISPATVNKHVQRLYAKLGVRAAGAAVAKAIREGLA